MTQVPQQPQQSQVPQKAVAESTIDLALARVKELKDGGNLQLPTSYSYENSIRAAWLLIQQTKDLNGKFALQACTPVSIINALQEMVLQGLNPTKKQCYFIVYGDTLTMQKSYFGQIAISKRVAGVKDAVGVPIYQKDVFKYTIDVTSGIKTVTQHEQEFDNIDPQNVRGAYAVVTYEDGHIEYEIMTMQQIRSAWEMGKAKGNSPAHKNFPDQMAAKTVVSRALKIPVNSSNDDDLFDPEEQATMKSKQMAADVNIEIKENGNGASATGPIGFDEEDEEQLQEPVDPMEAPEVQPTPEHNITQQRKVPF